MIHNSISRVFQNTGPLESERQPSGASKFPIIAKSLDVLKKILNESIFQHFSALITPYLEFQSFSGKSDSVTFEHLYPLPSCKVSSKSLEPILRKVRYEHMYGRTDAQTGMNS